MAGCYTWARLRLRRTRLVDLYTEIVNGVLIACPQGRVDGSNAQVFQRLLLVAAKASEGPVILDCTDLAFISSAGLGGILFVVKGLAEADRRVLLCSRSKPVEKTLRISGFEQLVPIHGSRSEALTAVVG